MATRAVFKKTIISRKNTTSLLFPMAAFLGGSGLTKKEAIGAFSSIYDQAVRTLHSRKMEYVGHTFLYQEIVALWVRDKQFLDESGKPRNLSLRGRSSFSTLVRLVQPEASPKVALSVLVRCGNVRRIGKERYALVRSFFRTDGPKSVAFEPNARFLSDFCTTLGNILRNKSPSGFSRSFWRKVEFSNLSASIAKKFSLFARERTLMFLEELDDWLEAHGNKSENRKVGRRVGIGVFSIFSDPEIKNP